jgi:hypothetical protein
MKIRFIDLLESPDTITLPSGKELDTEYPNYTFGYYNNNFMCKKNSYHYEMINDIMMKLEVKSKEWMDLYNRLDSRDILQVAGRLWQKEQVLTFWKNPTKQELRKLITDLKKYNVNITNDWLIETDEYEFQTVGEYEGKDRMLTNIQMIHTLNPIEKQQLKRKLNGFGSEKQWMMAKRMGFKTVAEMNFFLKEELNEN